MADHLYKTLSLIWFLKVGKKFEILQLSGGV